MTDLMQGKGTKDDYIALVAQHYFIYEALEGAEKNFADDAVAAAFITPRLTRLPAIEADLQFLLGDDWREQIAPLPTTVSYVKRINEVAATWCGGFIAHHYTRYLGDLSGGQHIRRLMQRHFGFDTNGVGFYFFDEIASPKDFKDTYRSELIAPPQGDHHAARLKEVDVVAALPLCRPPAERLVEAPRALEIGNTESDQADALFHHPIMLPERREVEVRRRRYPGWLWLGS
jgi:heme oxygenase